MQARLIRNLLIFCIGMAFSQITSAQNASRIYIEPTGWSIGTNCGLSDLWGDIGTASPLDHYSNSKYFDKVTFMGGMFGRYTVHPCFALKFMGNYGTLYATDKWNYDLAHGSSTPTQAKDGYQRYARNQNAKDYTFEGAFMMELTPLRFNPESKMAHKKGQIYIAAGVGIMHFTPYSTVENSPRWVKTYDLHLEGQGFGAGYPDQFNLWQPIFPFAIGYRWDMGQHFNLGIEYMWRMTLTDYLDGVSGKYLSQKDYTDHLSPHDAALAQAVADKGYWTGLQQPATPGTARGNPGNNDSYSTISIIFYYKVNTRTREWWH